MKTAISIPDPVFRAAEKLAKKRGISRSELYSTAMENYLREQETAYLIKKMNEACDAMGDTSLDPGLRAAQMKVLRSEAW